MATRPQHVVGIRGRSSVSQSLGSSDPRHRRNQQVQVPGEDYAEPLIVDEFGRLALDETALLDTFRAANGYEADVGDGSATTILVAHKLGTRAVQVTLYANASPFAEVVPTVRHTDVDTITLVFGVAPTANQYHVAVSR
jgi:hypothetical protein